MRPDDRRSSMPRTNLLSGKIAVVTGGSSGNGRAIATAFAHHGAKGVVIADVRSEPREGGEPTHEAIRAIYDTMAEFVPCDVTNPADLDAAVSVAEDLGGIDVMVSNAGILEGRNWVDSAPEEFRRTMDINVAGVFYGGQAAAKRMLERGHGVIINMCSIAGMIGSGDYIAYSTSKGAVKMLTASMASSLGQKGIRVNSIAPGYIDTALNDKSALGTDAENYSKTIPLGRWGEPEDVAGVAVFLASDLSAFVHGESVVVDGGTLNCRLPKLS